MQFQEEIENADPQAAKPLIFIRFLLFSPRYAGRRRHLETVSILFPAICLFRRLLPAPLLASVSALASFHELPHGFLFCGRAAADGGVMLRGGLCQ